jgi:hypothetical protein
MKIIILLILSSIVQPNLSFASGTLSIKQPFFSYTLIGAQSGQYNPDIGLFINERLAPRYEFQSWTGFSNLRWFMTDAYVLYKVTPDLKFGIGASYNAGSFQNDAQRVSGKLDLECRLW